MPWRSRAQARRCRSHISRRVRPPSPRRPPRPLARSPRRRVLRRRCPRNPRLRVRSLRPGPRNVRCRRRSSVRRHPPRRRSPWPSNVRLRLRRRRPPRPHSARNGLLPMCRRGRTIRSPMATWTRPCPRTSSSTRRPAPRAPRSRIRRGLPVRRRARRRHRWQRNARRLLGSVCRSLRLRSAPWPPRSLLRLSRPSRLPRPRPSRLLRPRPSRLLRRALRRSRLSRRLPARVLRKPPTSCGPCCRRASAAA